ncbi:MAG: hypothetical protein ACREM3_31570 [Candidatus Rokuibacteriota bacterium]
MPRRKGLVAKTGDGAVVATVTVVEDARADLGRLRERGRRNGEAGPLAAARARTFEVARAARRHVYHATARDAARGHVEHSGGHAS